MASSPPPPSPTPPATSVLAVTVHDDLMRHVALVSRGPSTSPGSSAVSSAHGQVKLPAATPARYDSGFCDFTFSNPGSIHNSFATGNRTLSQEKFNKHDAFPALPQHAVPPSRNLTSRPLLSTFLRSRACGSRSGSLARANIVDLPHEILFSIYLYLPNPSNLLLSSRVLNVKFNADPFLIANWLLIYNHFIPQVHQASGGNALDIRTAVPVHPLLAAMRHPLRAMLLDRNPAVAEMLLVLQPIISRYELQRIYRRGFAYKGQGHGGLFECTEIVSRFASRLFRTAFSESVFDVFPQPIDDHYYTLVQMNTNEDAIQSAANNPPIIPSPQYIAPEFAARETYNGIVSTIDDRRYLFHAVDNGVIGAVNYFLMRNALCLDAHTYADAFSRAWDSGDPFNLCLPRVGALWPRSSAARWLVLEKLVKEEDEVFTVFALQTAFATMAAAGNGVGDGVGGAFAGFGEVGEEVIDSILHCMRVCFAIIEDEWNFCEQGALSDYSHKKKFSGFRDLTISRTCDALLAAGILHEVVGIAENEGNPDNHKCDGPWSIDNVYESVFKGRRNNHPSLWSNKTPFAQRAFDGFVAFGSVRMVALIMYKYAEHITVKPYHLTAALDRSSLPLVYFLIQYVGANPSWEEDPRLFEYLRKPGDPSIFGGPTPSSDGLDNAGRACWAWALEHGVSLTERRWSSILKLGPMTVSAVIDYFGVQSFDPCMYNMAGFCHASLPVFRALSRAVDAKYSETSKCVLWEAAYGDQAALSYVTRLGEILLQDLKLGDHERAMELLHAGAIVLDDVMLAVAAIADLPPGDWEDWTIAARCYRRVLAQQRLCLPIPSRKTLEMLPKTVVNVSFLTALYSTRPIHCNPLAANVYSLYQRQRHHNTAGVRINLVPVLERDVAARVVAAAMEQLRELLKMCNDPSYPGESYCFIKGMLQYGLRDKNLLRDEDEFFLPDDEWSDVANSLTCS